MVAELEIQNTTLTAQHHSPAITLVGGTGQSTTAPTGKHHAVLIMELMLFQCLAKGNFHPQADHTFPKDNPYGNLHIHSLTFGTCHHLWTKLLSSRVTLLYMTAWILFPLLYGLLQHCMTDVAQLHTLSMPSCNLQHLSNVSGTWVLFLFSKTRTRSFL